MKWYVTGILFCSVIFFNGCGSAQENAYHQFYQLSDSLDKVSENYEQKTKGYEFYYKKIVQQRDKYPVAGCIADSFNTALQSGFHFIDSLKELLQKKDGNKYGIINKTFANSRFEDQENKLSMNIYVLAKGLTSINVKLQIDSVMKKETDYAHQKGWAKAEFLNVPAYVISTNLVLIRRGYENAGNIVMRNIYEGIKK